MWFTQKSKVGLSQEFFIEKQGQIERFSKEKLIVSNVKKATVQYDTPVVVQLVSHVSLTTPWTAAHQASLSFTSFWSLYRLMSIELVMPSNRLILCHTPFSSCLQSFPASGSFLMSQLFASGGQSIGGSVLSSVLPMNNQSHV